VSKTSKIEIDERLKRLVHSSICPAEDATNYARELMALTDLPIANWLEEKADFLRH